MGVAGTTVSNRQQAEKKLTEKLKEEREKVPGSVIPSPHPSLPSKPDWLFSKRLRAITVGAGDPNEISRKKAIT